MSDERPEEDPTREPEPDRVEAIRRGRKERAERLGALLGSPEGPVPGPGGASGFPDPDGGPR